jgi:hypothetical protein
MLQQIEEIKEASTSVLQQINAATDGRKERCIDRALQQINAATDKRGERGRRKRSVDRALQQRKEKERRQGRCNRY